MGNLREGAHITAFCAINALKGMQLHTYRQEQKIPIPGYRMDLFHSVNGAFHEAREKQGRDHLDQERELEIIREILKKGPDHTPAQSTAERVKEVLLWEFEPFSDELHSLGIDHSWCSQESLVSQRRLLEIVYEEMGTLDPHWKEILMLRF